MATILNISDILTTNESVIARLPGYFAFGSIPTRWVTEGDTDTGLDYTKPAGSISVGDKVNVILENILTLNDTGVDELEHAAIFGARYKQLVLSKPQVSAVDVDVLKVLGSTQLAGLCFKPSGSSGDNGCIGNFADSENTENKSGLILIQDCYLNWKNSAAYGIRFGQDQGYSKTSPTKIERCYIAASAVASIRFGLFGGTPGTTHYGSTFFENCTFFTLSSADTVIQQAKAAGSGIIADAPIVFKDCDFIGGKNTFVLIPGEWSGYGIEFYNCRFSGPVNGTTFVLPANSAMINCYDTNGLIIP